MAAPNAEEQEALDLHNHARIEVGNKALSWHHHMLIGAASWAQTLAERDSGMEHFEQPDGQARCGENLYMAGGGMQGNHLLLATQCWYDEKPMWHGQAVTAESKGSSEEKHYTQMIWMDTTHFGIAAATSRSGTTYVVGRYWPPGNYIGRKPAEQVAPPSAPTFQGGGGMRGGSGGGMRGPGGFGGGQMGGMSRPGGFGGGHVGGIGQMIGIGGMNRMGGAMGRLGGFGGGQMNSMSGMGGMSNGAGGMTVMNNGGGGFIVVNNGGGSMSVMSNGGDGCMSYSSSTGGGMSSTSSTTGMGGMNVNTNFNGEGGMSCMSCMSSNTGPGGMNINTNINGMMPGMMAMGGTQFGMPPGMPPWMMGGPQQGMRGPTPGWGGPRPWSPFG